MPGTDSASRGVVGDVGMRVIGSEEPATGITSISCWLGPVDIVPSR